MTPPLQGRNIEQWVAEMERQADDLRKVHADTGRPSAVYHKMQDAIALAAVLRDAAKTRDERDALRSAAAMALTYCECRDPRVAPKPTAVEVRAALRAALGIAAPTQAQRTENEDPTP